MQPAKDKESFDRLDAIIEGASKLSVEKQEVVLAVIEGMAFTRRHLEKQQVQTPEEKEAESRFA